MTNQIYDLAEEPDNLGALDAALKGVTSKVRWLTFETDTMRLNVELSAELTDDEEAAVAAVVAGPAPPVPVRRTMAVSLADRVSPLREVKALWR